MKKVILALSLVAVLSTTFVSCSADDSDVTTNKSADTVTLDNGNKDNPFKPSK